MLDDWSEINWHGVKSIQRTYSDGTDVIISIRMSNDCYEIWTIVEHRVSGPVESMNCFVGTYHDAIENMLVEAKGWDLDFL
ncbi:hypothetical protein L4174_022350 [Photobacterium sp. CCB-ST2H9]|uniref:hypothetical protein n=1 Tax=Photobacterium sp. CCB-ST2H9 TaxID=2912855 RepID=UPI002002A07D|nr:hypothetical protein [Photobacterium sp. CCB-ST2H9]UTM59441.1 hypothetical protein L4174_022350 [Photobacterium sp. CCB-ST2H9]